jgi:antitoxin MazE
MKVEKWGDGLVVPVPDDVAKALDLKPGDDVNLVVKNEEPRKAVTPEERAAVLRSIAALARPLPPGWKFDREEANER